MYSEKQKKEHIKELQRMLYEISFYNTRIPTIIPDGIYGPETAEAVKAFQREYGLTPTGSVDSQTFDRIVEVYNYFYRGIMKPDIFNRDTLLIPGSAGPIVYLAQLMLNTISSYYANMPITELTGIYDDPTDHMVSTFKIVSGNSANGEGIDVDLWNDIVSKFNKLVL